MRLASLFAALGFLCCFVGAFSLPVASGAAVPEDGDSLDAVLKLLVAPDPTVRRNAARSLKARLDPASAGALLAGLPGQESGVRRAVREVMAGGGPWMPGVLRALGKGEAVSLEARSVLDAALRKRPLEDEPLRGTISIDIFDKDAGLVFPGPWPGAVPLDVVLDRINEAAGLSCPFVLSPRLAMKPGSALPVRKEPIAGSADMVLDLILMERGLGIELLETVILVTGNGGSCDSLSPGEQGFDSRLLDEIMDVYSAAAEPASRPAALKALAWLDPPGFLHGYLQEFRRDGGGECLDYLLYGRAAPRFAVALALDDDAAGAAALIRAFFLEEDLYRGESIHRTVLLLPGDLRRRALDLQQMDREAAWLLFGPVAIDDAEASGRTAESIGRLLRAQDPDRRMIGLRAVLRHVSTNGEAAETLCVFLRGWERPGGPAAVLADRCLRRLGAGGDDGELAELLTSLPLRRGLLHVAAARGDDFSLDAVVSLLEKDREDNPLAVAAVFAVLRRLEAAGSGPDDASFPSMTAVNRAALHLLMGGSGQPVGETAAPLLEALQKKEDGAARLTAMLSFAPPHEIVGLIDPLYSRLEEENRDGANEALMKLLREALIRCASSRLHARSLAASRVRVDCSRASSGIGNDALLDHALRIAEGDGKPGSLDITVDIF